MRDSFFLLQYRAGSSTDSITPRVTRSSTQRISTPPRLIKSIGPNEIKTFLKLSNIDTIREYNPLFDETELQSTHVYKIEYRNLDEGTQNSLGIDFTINYVRDGTGNFVKNGPYEINYDGMAHFLEGFSNIVWNHIDGSNRNPQDVIKVLCYLPNTVIFELKSPTELSPTEIQILKTYVSNVPMDDVDVLTNIGEGPKTMTRFAVGKKLDYDVTYNKFSDGLIDVFSVKKIIKKMSYTFLDIKCIMFEDMGPGGGLQFKVIWNTKDRFVDLVEKLRLQVEEILSEYRKNKVLLSYKVRISMESMVGDEVIVEGIETS